LTTLSHYPTKGAQEIYLLEIQYVTAVEKRKTIRVKSIWWLSEDLLHRDVGILAGLLTNCISMVWARKRYFTYLYEGHKIGVKTHDEGYVTTRLSFPNCCIEPFGAVRV
jgi:hypothetical protein